MNVTAIEKVMFLTLAAIAISFATLAPTLGQNLLAEAATENTRATSEMAQERLNDLMANRNTDGIPIVVSYVDKDGTLVVGINDTPESLAGYQNKLQKLVGDNVVVRSRSAEVVETSCSSRTSTCSPLTGGIEINANYTGGRAGTITFAATDNTGKKGFVIAGHVAGFGTGMVVGQPTTSVVGTVITNPHGTQRDSDSAFVEFKKDIFGNYQFTGDEWKIWKSSSSSYAIVSKKLKSQLVGNELIQVHGYVSGVINGGITGTNYSITNPEGILLRNQFTYVVGDGHSPPTQGGDSGAAVTSTGTSNVDLYGISYGYIDFVDNGVHNYIGLFSPWDGIKSELNLS